MARRITIHDDEAPALWKLLQEFHEDDPDGTPEHAALARFRERLERHLEPITPPAALGEKGGGA